MGAEILSLRFDFEDLGVEGGLFADLEGEEVGGTLFEAFVFGGFELLGWTPADNLDDVRPDLADDYAVSLKTVKGWDLQIRKVLRII